MAETVIPFGQNITYDCLTGQRLVSDKDVSTVDVECQTSGEYDYPTTWPQCTDMILCDDITVPTIFSSTYGDKAAYYNKVTGDSDTFT